MKILYRFRCSFLIWMALLLLASTSCQTKKWDEYYNISADRKGAGVFEIISANPDYTEFTALIRKAGLDSLLTATGQFTVLPVKNGAMGTIDMNNLAQVSKIMDMHVLPLAIYQSGMNRYNTITLLGKSETFDKDYVWVNAGKGKDSIRIIRADIKAFNGVIHEVSRYIVPYDNLMDALAGNVDYSIFYNYIKSTRSKILDLKLSMIIGYDSIARPVYDSIFTFKYAFFDQAAIGDESAAYTIFVPTNNLVNRVLTSDIHVPWGGVFPYSSFFSNLVKDRFFKSCIVPGLYRMGDLSDVNKLKTTLGTTLTISKTQIGLSDQKVSNGIFHVLNNIDIPDYVAQVPIVSDGYISYATKPSKLLVPDEMPLVNFADGSTLLSQQVPNIYNWWYAYPYYYLNTAVPPVVQYRTNITINGTSSFWYPYNFTNPSATNIAALAGTAIVFTLPAKYSAMTSTNPSGTYLGTFSTHSYRIDFVGSPGTSKVTINSFSELPRGWYKVILNTLDSDNSGIFDISYGATSLLKDYNASNPFRNRPNVRQQISLGPIYNPAYGKIPITFTLRDKGTNNLYQLELDAILFTAVTEP